MMIRSSLRWATRARGIRYVALVLVLSTVGCVYAGVAQANYHGYVLYIGGQGTRASIILNNASETNNCVVFSSVVADTGYSSRQLQIGVARCNNAYIDSTACGATNPFMFVERIAYTGSATCYAHGSISIGVSNLYTVDDSGGTGTYYTYLNGTQYEGQSGYNSVGSYNYEWGEYTQSTCSGWNATAYFYTWQYWTAGQSWLTITGSNGGWSKTSEGCWGVGSPDGSGDFTISY